MYFKNINSITVNENIKCTQLTYCGIITSHVMCAHPTTTIAAFITAEQLYYHFMSCCLLGQYLLGKNEANVTFSQVYTLNTNGTVCCRFLLSNLGGQ